MRFGRYFSVQAVLTAGATCCGGGGWRTIAGGFGKAAVGFEAMLLDDGMLEGNTREVGAETDNPPELRQK
jgi:hypothetical protein